MAEDVKIINVELSTKGEKPKKKEFEMKVANKLLSMPKSGWTLTDPKFEWNGTEIAKKAK